MARPASEGATKPTAREWSKLISEFANQRFERSALEVAVTIAPYLTLLIGAMWLASAGQWWALILVFPASAFLLRVFTIQHDAGHGSLFADQRLNRWVGRFCGVLTFTPYAYWQRAHALHHSMSGCLDYRGIGDIDTFTVREYEALSTTQKLMYRLYRHPLVMFGLGPFYIFVLKQRLPFGMMRDGWKMWASTLGTTVFMALFLGSLVWAFGWLAVLAIQLPIIMIGGAAGVWLFFVQHQFEETIWENREDWDRHEAALHGSSFYDLPLVANWFTANIGMHHLHHLNSKIPFYNLPKVLKRFPELAEINRLTLAESVKTVRLALWDEDRKRLVGFGAV